MAIHLSGHRIGRGADRSHGPAAPGLSPLQPGSAPENAGGWTTREGRDAGVVLSDLSKVFPGGRWRWILHQTYRTTTRYVTHEQVEAMTLGDRIAVLNAGRLQQAGTPEELYRAPCNVFASPAMNLASATLRDGTDGPADDRRRRAGPVRPTRNPSRPPGGRVVDHQHEPVPPVQGRQVSGQGQPVHAATVDHRVELRGAHRPSDALRGEPAVEQHHGYPQHPVGYPIQRRPHWTVHCGWYEAGRVRSGRACARRRTGCRRCCSSPTAPTWKTRRAPSTSAAASGE